MSLICNYNQFKQKLTEDIPEVAQKLFRPYSKIFYTITDNTNIDWSLYKYWGKYYLYEDNNRKQHGKIFPFTCTTRPDKNVYYVTEDYTYFCHYHSPASYTDTLEIIVFSNDRFKEPHDADFVDMFYEPAPGNVEPIPQLATEKRRNNNGTGI